MLIESDTTSNDQPSKMSWSPSHLRASLATLLTSVYPNVPAEALTNKVITSFWGDKTKSRRRGRIASNSLWNEKDSYVICYGNSLVDGQHKPLDLLYDFLNKRLKGTINGVHILPYFPYTSDDGFAVTDYTAVDSRLGSWADIQRIAEDFRLMSDLVLNHCSSQSNWFNAYRQGHSPWDQFFREALPTDDLSAVVRNCFLSIVGHKLVFSAGAPLGRL